MKTFLASLTLVTVSFLSAQVDARSNGVRGIGPRLGVASDPDQFRFGGHLDLGDIAPNLVIMPNVEFGIGDDVTTIAPTFELDYRFRSGWSEWGGAICGWRHRPCHLLDQSRRQFGRFSALYAVWYRERVIQQSVRAIFHGGEVRPG